MEKEPSYVTTMRNALFFIEQQSTVGKALIKKKEAICQALRKEITKAEKTPCN